MSSRPLAVPIRARIDTEGRIRTADAELLRWQWRAGGRDDGPLALPPLANLAAESARLGMRLSEPVDIGEEDGDLSLWVEAVPDADGVALAIVSRLHIPLRQPPGREAAMLAHGRRPDDGAVELQIDADGRLMASAPPLAGVEAGAHLDTIFQPLADEAGRLRMIEAMPERQPFSGQRLRLRGDGTVFVAEGGPLVDAGGHFAGMMLRLTAEAPDAADRSGGEPLLDGRFIGDMLAPALRQPLSRIVANAETIGARTVGPLRQNYADYARDIADAARHLVALIDDLSDLEALERPDFAPARDPVDLADCARRAAGLLAVRATDRAIAIRHDIDRSIPAIGEYRRVLQILVNLIGNAVRYAPDASEVTIRGGSADQMCWLSVSDAGSGIAPTDRERVFAKFERLGRDGDGGSGLGLYIARRLARAMDGELSVDEAEEGGARFTLHLPCR